MEPVLYDRSDDDYDPMVLMIDDDPDVREGLRAVFESVNLHSKAFGSAEEFFRSKLPERVSCLVLDVRLPGLSGLDLQTELAKVQIDIPIIFITGHAIRWPHHPYRRRLVRIRRQRAMSPLGRLRLCEGSDSERFGEHNESGSLADAPDTEWLPCMGILVHQVVPQRAQHYGHFKRTPRNVIRPRCAEELSLRRSRHQS
jgi:response regulator receiver domain-containing protein